MKVIDDNDELNALRSLREQECFPIVNRGRLWYNSLTDIQLSELKDWYFAWLDVTETKIIPVKPDWLNNKIKMEEIIW